MVKKKKVVKKKSYFLLLTCQECGHKFRADRFKKYCSYKCQRLANRSKSKIRYAEMRDLMLRSKGLIK